LLLLEVNGKKIVLGLYMGEKLCHVWPKTGHDLCFVTVKNFETTKNVSRLGKT